MKKKGNPHKKSKKKNRALEGKAKSEFIHASRRLEERYEEVYTFEMRSVMVSMIKKNQTISTVRQTTRVSEFLLEYNKKQYKGIYDKQRGEIVTFLPLNI